MFQKIEAIIREEKLDDVKEALRAIGIVGLNIFEVHDHGRQGGIPLAWRSTAYVMDMIPKIQINIVLSPHNVEKTIETICNAASTGQAGDGLIFIHDIKDVVRIRTRERGSEALSYAGDIDEMKAKQGQPTKKR